jgi:CBS domain-containing protein
MQAQSDQLVVMGGSWRAPTFAHARVADAMRSGVIACPPDSSLRTVARMMATNHVHSVVVTAGGEAPIAVISEHELLDAAGSDPEDVRAESIAVEPVTVSLDDPVSRAVELMLEHRVSHLLVVSAAGHGLGVISALDVAGVMAWGQG